MSKSILKHLLTERGLTTQKFANIAGLNKRSLEPYISGAKKFNKTQLWFAMKIADTLNINPHILMEDDKNNNKVP